MSDALAGAAARALARKSNRRQLFKFLGMSSLGAGLFSLARQRRARRSRPLRRLRRRAVQPVRVAVRAVLDNALQAVRPGRRLPRRLHDDRRVVLLHDRDAVPPALLGVLLPEPAGLLPLLHRHQHAVPPDAALG